MTSTRYGTVAEFDWILGFQFDLDFSIFENNQREYSVWGNIIKGKKNWVSPRNKPLFTFAWCRVFFNISNYSDNQKTIE